MFSEYLKKVVDNTEGAIAGLIMGLDGIAVDKYVREQDVVDIDTIGMEFSFILTQVKKAADTLDVGAVQELSIKAEQLTIVIRMVTDEYFLATALRMDGNFGKARFLMRIVAPKLVGEL